MNFEKIILDLLNRIVTLEERVEKLENNGSNTQSNDLELPAGSKKYRFLSDYLHESNAPRIKLFFSEIEDILKFKLPDSATTHRAFWANTTSHSIALSWLSVNYSVVEVDLDEKYITFEKNRDFGKMTGNAINHLWNYGTEANWLDALNQYDVIIDSRSSEAQWIEKFMDQLDAENVKNMSLQEFYDFLYEKYFFWVFTQKNRLATTRKQLQRYVDENRMFELGTIHKELFEATPADVEKCLNIAMSIRGLGIAGASGLLSVLFPNDFGGINEFIATSLRSIEGIVYGQELSQMNPTFLTAKDGAVLTKIYREKANELNRRFDTDFWTPRKIDKVLWACGR